MTQKIVTPQEMRQIEEKAFQAGITHEMLMNEAGKKITERVIEFIEENSFATKILVLAGKGNNGGDVYTAAKRLYELGFQITALQVFECENDSLCQKKRQEFEAIGGQVTSVLTVPTEGIVLDGIFGIGFQGKVEGIAAQVIERINQSKLPIVAIDIPSGVNGETGAVETVAIRATLTLTCEWPKLGFFLDQGWNFIGDLKFLPIGLAKFAEGLTTELQYFEKEDAAKLLPKIERNRHKYQAGHVVGLAGSEGMAGAAIMASWACLKAGAGIVHLLHPESLLHELSGPPWELVRVAFKENDFDTLRAWIQKAKACFIGPGLGSSVTSEKLLTTLWNDYKDKSVLDADALNWIARDFGDPFAIGPLPTTIFTPHLGEMKRLLGIVSHDPVSVSFLRTCKEFVEKNQTNLVLKGGPSFLFSHGEAITLMPRGDPGMASAGSGDVLTGILSSLLGQGLEASKALKLGTYLHGLAGEFAAQSETSYCITATTLITFLPKAFQELTR
jgi:ADP-dependent NAD(P)H-hydrate dehydratase / NAD(P)H-hydrate epimerase